MAKISTQCINDLRAKLSAEARIVLENDDNYRECIKRWSAAAEKPAAIIVFPRSAKDVSKTLQFAQSLRLDLAVKGGGHATSGSSSTDGGLCIDLSLMRNVSADTEKLTIRAAGGAIWRDVYEAGEAVGLACVGGTVDDTGIGGLTLGGGYGYMSAAHGLVIDNLLEVEYVLADGSIVIASKHENPDLFWAARGAGAGFGVATSFLYQAHRQVTPVWGGLITFSVQNFGAVIEAGNHFIALNDEKGSLVIYIMNPPPTYSPVISALVYYNGLEVEAKEAFTKLLQLSPVKKTLGYMSYLAVNQLFSNGVDMQDMRYSMKGAAFHFPLSPSFAKILLDEFSLFVAEVPDAALSILLFEFFPYHKITSISQSDTAFANRGAYGNLLSILGWRNPVDDTRCREWARYISAMSKREFISTRDALKTDDMDGVGEYFNYDGIETSGSSIFGANFPRLMELKKRYDPHNLFKKGPKLLESSCSGS